MLTYRSKVLLLAFVTSTSCVATGSNECFVGANTAFEADAAGKRCCEAADGTWGACPEQITGSTTSVISTSTSPTATDWTSTTTSTTSPLDTDTSSTTAAMPVCGDGVPQDPEKCDPECLADIDSAQDLEDCIADSNCRLDCKWVDRKVECGKNACAELAECGDGIVNAPEGFSEQCDDGNGKNGDGCTHACQHEICGDGIRNAPDGVLEDCDDGNSDNGDACTNACTNAKCGDGALQKDEEECDDGGLQNNDGCSDACQNEWVIFVTSMKYDGDLGGIAAADNLCASVVNLKFHGKYVAWLSGPDVDNPAGKRLPPGKKFIDTRGNTIVDQSEQLTKNGPVVAITFDENRAEVSGWAWTGTHNDGSAATDFHCNGWKTSKKDAHAYAGHIDDKTAWSLDLTNSCDQKRHLYCFRADE